jgi:hypothetical protein
VLKAEHHHAGTYQVGPFGGIRRLHRPQLLMRKRRSTRRRRSSCRRAPAPCPPRRKPTSRRSASSCPHLPVRRRPLQRHRRFPENERNRGFPWSHPRRGAGARAPPPLHLSHTHWPRILVDSIPWRHLVTMDCGAWTELTILGGRPEVHSSSPVRQRSRAPALPTGRQRAGRRPYPGGVI